jgi:hypothetical protein
MLISEITLYHGTPHNFDNFSTDHVGKGEGFQAFGWGLYFASVRAVAEWYRAKLSPRPFVKYDNEIYDIRDKMFGEDKYAIARDRGSLLSQDVAIDTKLNIPDELLDTFAAWGHDLIEYIISTMLQNRSKVEDIANSFKPQHIYDDELEHYEKMRAIVVKQCNEIERVYPEKSGFVYEVDVPEELFLHWDKTLSQQSPEVAKLLSDYPRYYKGQDIYNRLATDLGNQKAASMELLKRGIKGLVFFDMQSRGNNEKQTLNYVLFSSNSVNIRRVY